MAGAKRELAVSKPSTESSVDWDDPLKLRRAFNAARKRCKKAENKQQQREAFRELLRLTRRINKAAKRMRSHSNYGDMRPRLLRMLTKMMEELYEDTESPALSNFSHEPGATGN